MAYMIQQKAYEPAAMAIISFALTWAAMGIISLVGRGNEQAQVGGGH
jgi:putative spermidine/putrescine transport system permease protein